MRTRAAPWPNQWTATSVAGRGSGNVRTDATGAEAWYAIVPWLPSLVGWAPSGPGQTRIPAATASRQRLIENAFSKGNPLIDQSAERVGSQPSRAAAAQPSACVVDSPRTVSRTRGG